MKLYDGGTDMKILVPPAGANGAESKYTNTKPDGNWASVKYDDSSWSAGKGRYTSEEPAVSHTAWPRGTPDIWVRREVTLESVPAAIKLMVFHDDDVEVYINGVQAVARKTYTSGFMIFDISPEAKRSLKKGKNIIAMHCNSPKGANQLDVGIVAVMK